MAPYQEIAAESVTFLDILFVEANKFSSGTSDYFLFPYTLAFCKLTGTSRVKSFSSCHTFFSIMRVLRSNFSANAMLGVCAELRLLNKSVLQLDRYFLVVTDLVRPEPSFLFMVSLSLKLQKSFYGRVSPVFR